MSDWMDGIPRVPNTAIFTEAPGPRPLAPHAAVTHRTIGHWAGDLSVLTRARVPSCHFLVGEERGQWCQMVPVNVVANHAWGANGYAVGIEMSGQNGSPLTVWQIEAAQLVTAWLNHDAGISLARYTGEPRVSDFAGFLDHAKVDGGALDHSDYWNPDDWNRVTSPSPGIDWAALAKLRRLKGQHMFLYQDSRSGAIYAHEGGWLTYCDGPMYDQFVNQLGQSGQDNRLWKQQDYVIDRYRERGRVVGEPK